MQVAKSRDMICQIQIYNLVVVVHLMNFMGYGCPVRYRKTIGQINENVRLEHEKKYGEIYNFEWFWAGWLHNSDVVRSKAITSMQAHRTHCGYIGNSYIDNCNGVVHPVIGKMFPPPTKHLGKYRRRWCISQNMERLAIWQTQSSSTFFGTTVKFNFLQSILGDSPASKDKTRRSKLPLP